MIGLIIATILLVSNIFVLNKKINTFTDDVEYLIFVIALIGFDILVFLAIIMSI